MATDTISLPPILDKSDYLEMKSSGMHSLADYYDAEKLLPAGQDGLRSFYVQSKDINPDEGMQLAQVENGGRIVVMHHFPRFYKKFFENPSLLYDDTQHNWYKDIPGQPIAYDEKRPRLYGIAPETDRQRLRVYNGETQMYVDEQDPTTNEWLGGEWISISRNADHMGVAASQALAWYLQKKRGVQSENGIESRFYYYAKLSAFWDLHEAASANNLTLNLNGAIEGIANGTLQDAMAACILDGWFQKATAVDITTGTVTFANKRDAQDALDLVFRRPDVAGEKPLDSWSQSVSYFIHGQVTESWNDDFFTTTAWAWKTYDALIQKSPDAVSVVDDYIKQAQSAGASLGTIPHGEARYDALIFPLLTEIKDGKPVTEIYQEFGYYSAEGVQFVADNFQLPPDKRLATPEEAAKYFKEASSHDLNVAEIQKGVQVTDEFGVPRGSIKVLSDQYMLRVGETAAGSAFAVAYIQDFYQPITPEQDLAWHDVDEWLTYDEASGIASLCKRAVGEGYEVDMRRRADEGFKNDDIEKTALYAVKYDEKIFVDAADALQKKIEETAVDQIILDNGMEFSRAEVEELIAALKTAKFAGWESVINWATKYLPGIATSSIQVLIFVVGLTVLGAAMWQIPYVRGFLKRGRQVEHEAIKEADANSPAEVLARRRGVYRSGVFELTGEAAVQAGNTWYDPEQSDRTAEMKIVLKYYYERVTRPRRYSHRQGALVGASGTGKGELGRMLGLGLRIGYYPDGTKVEQKYLDMFGDVAMTDPMAATTAYGGRVNYADSKKANVEAMFSIGEEYEKQTGKLLIHWVAEGASGLKDVIVETGNGPEAKTLYLYDAVYKENQACIVYNMTPGSDRKTGAAVFYQPTPGGTATVEIKRRVFIIPTSGDPNLVVASDDHIEGTWDIEKDSQSLQMRRWRGLARVAERPPNLPAPKASTFDPFKITEGLGLAKGREARTVSPARTPGNFGGNGGTGSAPSSSGPLPPASKGSAPTGSSTASASASTFAPKLTLAELAQIFPQLRQPFANPQVAIQAITQNLSEAQRMVWTQRICPEGLPLPQSSYEIALRLQRVVGEQNARMIFARSLFFCRLGTVSSPALGVMLMNAAILDPRSLSDPARAVVQAEQIVRNYERLIEEKRGRGEKVEEEARRAETWRRELERQKQQRERAVAVPL